MPACPGFKSIVYSRSGTDEAALESRSNDRLVCTQHATLAAIAELGRHLSPGGCAVSHWALQPPPAGAEPANQAAGHQPEHCRKAGERRLRISRQDAPSLWLPASPAGFWRCLHPSSTHVCLPAGSVCMPCVRKPAGGTRPCGVACDCLSRSCAEMRCLH